MGASTQPEPKRTLQTEIVQRNDSLPPLIGGSVSNEAGEPIFGASISLNTWSNRTGDFAKDIKLEPTVLAQSKTDANGFFQMTLDEGLEKKLIASNSKDGKQNAAFVVTSERRGTIQVPLEVIADPQNMKLHMVREMSVRGSVSSSAEIGTTRFLVGSQMHVYDTESIKKIIAGLKEGRSLEHLQAKFNAIATIDPLAGGVPLTWSTQSKSPFLVQSIPLNAVFELHAVAESGEQKDDHCDQQADAKLRF